MLRTLKELLADSLRGVASFNCVDLEMARACIEAAEEARRPVIIGVATRHWESVGGSAFIPSLKAFCEQSEVQVALHLDHAKPRELDILKQALDSGFTSVMIDGSNQRLSQNIDLSRRVVEQAAEYGASVEAELGPIPGEEGVAGRVDAAESSLFTLYTRPAEAKKFCDETGVDALAVAVGTAHGLYTEAPVLQLDLISELSSILTTPLVLHGATGIPDEAIREAVRRGVRKINFFSGLLVAGMKVAREQSDPEDNDYLGLRQRMFESWKDTADEMIRLYSAQ